MIELRDICVSFEGKKVLRHVSLRLPSKGVYALMAPSGAGKTTLLRVMAGLTAPDSGSRTVSPEARIACVFQEDRLLPWETALRNVALSSNEEKAARYLKEMEIDEVSLRPDEMSGGMCRRVALARALAYEGNVLLMDEPFKGLDVSLRERVMERLRSAAPLVVLSTHERAEADGMGAQIIQLEALQHDT